MEKIIYVVDKKGSALHTAATSRVTLSDGKILIANEYKSPHHLLEVICKEKKGIVLFCWRKALADIVSSRKSLKLYKQINNMFIFAFLIPDHMGLETGFERIENRLMQASDYYVVTSKILFDEYSARYPTQPPMAIFHDLPNTQLIEEIRQKFQKKDNNKIRILWVGNSRWGHHQGYKDHKGLNGYIKPLQEFINKQKNNFSLEIIDSSTENLSQFETLKRIHDSDILIQVSRNEGTGLAILEAIGLETFVLTTKVGIAAEVFSDDDPQILFDKSVAGIFTKIEDQANCNSTKPLREKYEKYIENAKQENLVYFKKTQKLIAADSQRSNLIIYAFWFYRFIIVKFNTVYSSFIRRKFLRYHKKHS